MIMQSIKKPEGVDLDHFSRADRPRILLIDDEVDTIFLLKQLFQLKGYDVSGALSGKEALSKFNEINPNIILLDLMMPEMDGWETFAHLRKVCPLPVIVISAISQSDQIVKALRMGADDYIIKPFNQDEVVARVKCVLRRSKPLQQTKRICLTSIDLMLDLESQDFVYKGKRVQLTSRMFEVLLLLAQNAPKVLTYEAITSEIWGEFSPSAHNRLKYLVYLLRQEFFQIDPHSQVIVNIDRVGYKLAAGG
jgi:DNA-binding response OmpR family regulator